MLWTAAHEMVHVLQGEYYAVKGLFTGRQNRWFIEATAQYFGALILGLSELEKAEFYPGSYSGNYLSVPITANNEGSFYLLGHLLDWLSRSYSTTLVQDTLRASSGNDQESLSLALVNAGCSGGLLQAFDQYLQYVLTSPEKEANLNGRIKSTMANYSMGYGLLSPGGLLGQNRTFATYTQALRQLSAGYINLSAQTNLTRSSLLVIEASLLPSSLETITYDFEGTSSRQYQGMEPVDKDHDYGAGTLGIADFRYNGTASEMEQLLYNTIDAVIPLEMNYYILIAPEILEIQDGAVLWDTSTVGNIPDEYIHGYNVYKGTVKLNPSIIPFAGSQQSFIHDSINADSADLRVQIMDKHGNMWPEIEEIDGDYYVFDYRSYSQTYAIQEYHPLGIQGDLPQVLDPVIPALENNTPVTSLGDRAFAEKGLTSVIIGDNIEYIGYQAFAGNDLSSISIPEKVSRISENAFYGNKLTSLTLGSGHVIGRRAFWDNLLDRDGSTITIGADIELHWEGLVGMSDGFNSKYESYGPGTYVRMGLDWYHCEHSPGTAFKDYCP
jgi:hypothetical protein